MKRQEVVWGLSKTTDGCHALDALAEGIWLYRQLPDAQLILSGGVLPGRNTPAAVIMAAFANSMGVPPEDILN